MSISNQFVKVLTPIGLAIILSACGGGSGADFGNNSNGAGGAETTDGSNTDAGTTDDATTDETVTLNPTDTGSEAASLTLDASSRILYSSGDEPITISAIAKDINNNVISDADVSFSADMDATLRIIESDGEVILAELTPGSQANRMITVTATSGDVTDSVQVKVDGTKVLIDGPASIAIDKPNEYTIKLQDSSGSAIAFEDLTVTSALGNNISPVNPTSFTTDANGQLIISLTSSAGGVDTISATSLNASVSQEVNISGSDFTLAGATLNKEIPINTNEVITLKWLVNGSPQAGKNISVRSTRGILSTNTVTTDANGEATFTITSDEAGSTTITAESDASLMANLESEFIATVPSYLNSQAEPSVISTNETSKIITKVRDINDNPVKNVKVNFNLSDTVNGSLSNSQATTDSLGRAEIIYSASDSISAFNGIKINTSLPEFPLVTNDLTELTIRGGSSRIVLGLDNLIAEDGVYYSRSFGVIVTDNAGNPIPNQEVNFTIRPLAYIKGSMVQVDTSSPADGEPDEWQQIITRTCPVEDSDYDGKLDAGEDTNNNGTLEPTNDAVITSKGSTDAEGKLTVQVKYPQSQALWSTQMITATTLVGGTEFVENLKYDMAASQPDLEDVDSAVPNELSPYGLSTSCFNDQ